MLNITKLGLRVRVTTQAVRIILTNIHEQNSGHILEPSHASDKTGQGIHDLCVLGLVGAIEIPEALLQLLQRCASIYVSRR